MTLLWIIILYLFGFYTSRQNCKLFKHSQCVCYMLLKSKVSSIFTDLAVHIAPMKDVRRIRIPHKKLASIKDKNLLISEVCSNTFYIMKHYARCEFYLCRIHFFHPFEKWTALSSWGITGIEQTALGRQEREILNKHFKLASLKKKKKAIEQYYLLYKYQINICVFSLYKMWNICFSSQLV